MNILIGTPAYNSMVHTDYLHSLLEFREANIPFSIMTIGNESLITRGRNSIISYFAHTMNFTHLLFLDADIGLSAEGLIKLISHEKDVIGAPVALKGKDAQGNSVYNVGEPLKQEGDLITTNRLGTAVFMLSRNAVNSLTEEAKNSEDVYYPNPLSRGTNLPDSMKMYDIFRTGVYEKEYLSEDFYVCVTLMNLGYEIFIDQTVQTKHNGMYLFE